MAKILTEAEIRPHDLFQKYLDLSKHDADTFFTGVPRAEMNCPACDDPGTFVFTKSGFAYRECPKCQTLWASPRPPFESFTAFYSDSPSSKYWADVFSPAVEEARRLRLWRPKAKEVGEIVANFEPKFRNVVDVGGGTGVFAEEFALVSDCNIVVVEPSPQAAARCRNRGIQVIQAFSEDLTIANLPSGRSLFTSFELFEHVHNPLQWMTKLSALMNSGDVLLVTTLSGVGLDIRLLWENSASVSPPHHINFLNPSSMRLIAERVGLEPVKVFTPGQLDMDIIKNNVKSIEDRFWRLICEKQSDEERQIWQNFISSVGLSSHMWAIMQKP